MSGPPYEVVWSAPAKRAIGKELPEAVAAAAIELILGALRDDPYRVGKPLNALIEGLWAARRATTALKLRVVWGGCPGFDLGGNDHVTMWVTRSVW